MIEFDCPNIFVRVRLGSREEGGTPLLGLYGDVPLDRVWFFGLAVLNKGIQFDLPQS